MTKAQGHITIRRRPKDGEAGDDAFRLDLNNENDSLLYDAEGNLLSGSVVTVATLYKGENPVGNATFAISERSGCTAQQATISGNTVTVTGISASGYVMVSATYNGHTYYAKFSLKRLVGTVKYDLVITPDAIAYNTTTETKSSSTINVKIFRTAQNASNGSTREQCTSIPSGYTLKVDGTTISSGYGSSGYTFNVDVSKASHVITLLQGTTVADEETVPINKSTNGAKGDNAIRLDLNNENDSLLYDAEGNLLSGSAVSVATLYSGDTAISSGVTFSISERSGCTSSQATISGNTVTVTGINDNGYVMVKARYNSKDYYAKFSLKKIIGDVKYDLVVSPDAVAYNTTTGTKSASSINVKIYRTAQNNSGSVTRSLVADVPSGHTLKVDGTTVNSASYDSGYTFNVDTSKSAHVVSLYKSSTLVDEETVPINKSTNGTDGGPGDPGANGEGVRMLYCWAITKPNKPTGTNPLPSGWSTSPDREGLTFTRQNTNKDSDITPDPQQTPNPITPIFIDDADGYRYSPAIGNSAAAFEKVIFTTTKARQFVAVHLRVSSENNYDWAYVGRLDIINATSTPLAKISGSNESVIVIYVENAGQHYFKVGYTKDSSQAVGKDKCWYRILGDSNLVCWMTQCKIDSAGQASDWTEPVKYGPEVEDTEEIFLLSKTSTVPTTPDSISCLDGYVPPLPGTTDYDDETQYYVENKVMYNHRAYECIETPDDYGYPPTNTDYWVEIPTWTSSKQSVSSTYRYRFVTSRKKTNGVWGAWGVPYIANAWGEDGLSPRTSKYTQGVNYRNDNNPYYRDANGVGYIDIVYLNEISIVPSGQPASAFVCQKTHVASAAQPSVGELWAAMNTTQPIYTALLLANKILAQYIDVDSLYVKHLNAADGEFSGLLSFPFQNISVGATIHQQGSTYKVYKIANGDSASLFVPFADRYTGSVYSSGPMFVIVDLDASTIPEGAIINITSPENYKNAARDVIIKCNSKIIYIATSDTQQSYFGSTIDSYQAVAFKADFFLRLCKVQGRFYAIQVLGLYHDGEDILEDLGLL